MYRNPGGGMGNQGLMAMRRYIRPTAADPPDARLRPPPPIRLLKPDEVRILAPKDVVDPRLRPIDRCFWRWAITPGSASSLWPMLARPTLLYRQKSDRPPPLDDAESRMIDVAVRESLPMWQNIVKLRYRFGYTGAEIALALSITRRQTVEEERDNALFFFDGWLRGRGLKLPPV